MPGAHPSCRRKSPALVGQVVRGPAGQGLAQSSLSPAWEAAAVHVLRAGRRSQALGAGDEGRSRSSGDAVGLGQPGPRVLASEVEASFWGRTAGAFTGRTGEAGRRRLPRAQPLRTCRPRTPRAPRHAPSGRPGMPPRRAVSASNLRTLCRGTGGHLPKPATRGAPKDGGLWLGGQT